MGNILYTSAIDKMGNLVKANDCKKGEDFLCQICKSKVILRKSGNLGKGTKRPHFAHKTLTPNCTPETALHYAFKNLLLKKIEQHLKAQMPLYITWLCKFCGDEHSGDLLKRVAVVRMEHNLTLCKPDIALLGDDEKVVAVIEVVVTHKPTGNVLKFYNDNKIILVQINLNSDEDIEDLENKFAHPSLVEFCYNPKCVTCGQFKQKKIMTIIEGSCWKCDNAMKIATISLSNGGSLKGLSNYLSPLDFTSNEIDFAKSKGVILKTQHSNTAQENYLANTCLKCEAFVGGNYLFTQYISPAGYGELSSEAFELGYHCEHCDGVDYEKDEETADEND